jgi:long-chain fatty acid transport protein
LLTLASIALFPSLAAGQIGPAFTGLTASAKDATAAFGSPAGITRLEESQLVTQGLLAITYSDFDVDQDNVGGGDGESDFSVTPIPGIFYVRPLSERWSLGLSFNVPSGIGYDFGTTWAGRYHVTETQLAFVAGQATVAYKLNDALSLSVGGYAMYVDSKTKVKVNNIDPSIIDGSVKLDESGATAGYVLGAMYEFSDTTRIGLTYRSELEPELDGTPTFSDLGPGLRESLAALDLLGTEVAVDFVVPAQLQVGFYTELSERWSTTGDVVWVDTSEFGVTSLQVEQDSISVEGTFRDVWVVSAGFEYQYAEDRKVSFGAMYASSATRNSDRVIALPLDRAIGLGVGFSFPFRERPTHVNVNLFDLGDGQLSEDGGPLSGDFSGSFSNNLALTLDFQTRF